MLIQKLFSEDVYNFLKQKGSSSIIITYLLAQWMEKNHNKPALQLIIKKAKNWLKKQPDIKVIESYFKDTKWFVCSMHQIWLTVYNISMKLLIIYYLSPSKLSPPNIFCLTPIRSRFKESNRTVVLSCKALDIQSNDHQFNSIIYHYYLKYSK